MATPLFEYLSIKDKYCIGYFGTDKELMTDLLKARKAIEKELVGLQVYIACKDGMLDLVKGSRNIILESTMPSFTGKVAYLRILEEKADLIQLLEESNIKVVA